MQPYRFYFLDGEEHIVKAELYDCIDDASAIRWLDTISLIRPRACPTAEIWCRDRMVHRQGLSDRATIMVGKGEEFRRKAQTVRDRSAFEPDKVRRRGLIAIADQYDRLADDMTREFGPAQPKD